MHSESVIPTFGSPPERNLRNEGAEEWRVPAGSPDNEEGSRTLPEDIYEKLNQYFPEQDLDKPFIEGSSISMTATGDVDPGPGAPPPGTENDLSKDTGVAQSSRGDWDRTTGSSERDRSGIRAKNLIHIVTEEHKKRIDETSLASPNASNPLPKSGTSTPEPTIFEWVRGELIGKGPYGRVYLALNTTTGEMMAVKQVEIAQTRTMVVSALKSESEILKDLDHPNIVQYLGFEETPSNLNIFLEYIPGGSIASLLLKHGKFPENVTKPFTSQILSGLEYLHSKGIMHRDIRADHILVEMNGVCKISSYGISKRITADEGSATPMQGTVFWMAPEVINPQGKVYNSKIDIWSVGCVVLEMWGGTRPWSGEEMLAVLFKLWSSKLPPPVPEGLILSELADDFRRKCFAINPDERPSAAELRRHEYLELPSGWVFDGFT
ncbi:kinase-like protein [Gymnopus androsaceus JB14]|uniref:Kinase-like protein n=1 Tax=Gymnopus androsaceus JB14 TaxID=1447944 RepID=A0A6A4HZB6_9AGAR|nr:kinase-like protein [Gymnopus androsaceus JB14]